MSARRGWTAAMAALSVALCAGPAWAQEEGEGDGESGANQPLSYLFVAAEYGFTRPSEGPESDGWTISGSTPIGAGTTLLGSYGRSETDPFEFNGATGTLEVTSYSGGLGFHAALSPIADFGLSLSYIRSEAEGQGGFAAAGEQSEDGYAAGIGLRSWLLPRTEFSAGGGYQRLGADGQTSFSLGLAYYLTRALSLGGNFSFSNNSVGWSGGLRWNFG